MGVIYNESKYSFGEEGHVWVLWDKGERDEYGLEIELLGENGVGGELVTLANWSFGEEPWSAEMWQKWGDYVSFRLSQIEGDTVKLKQLVEELEAIDCMYSHYQSPDEVTGIHLNHLNRINELITDYESQHAGAL